MSSEALQRIASVKQTSIASTALPLELQQHIFTFLDAKSFYNARRVCQWWNFASADVLPLVRQLNRLPILPKVDPAKTNPTDLERLFNDVGRTLMLGVKTERAHDRCGSLTHAARLGLSVESRVIATTPDGSRTVRMEDRMIQTFDTVGREARLLAERPINDLRETVGSGPWLKINASTYKEFALSANGSILAIAQERTIQIYDLNAAPDSFTLNEYVASASGHYICGLDFEQNDHVLRVRLSGKGAVVYLGTPPTTDSSKETATFEHWKSKTGLKHVFLDSSQMRVSNAKAEEEAAQPARISGIQLLRPFEEGYLFAGQRHGGGESSHYVLGHVRTTTPHNSKPAAAQHETVTVLTRLESFLSSFSYTLEASSEAGMGLWENMPSAHEHHPRFAMTSTRAFNFLALAERDKKKIRPTPLTQLFVYRLPTERELKETLAQSALEWEKTSTTLERSLNKLENARHETMSGADSESTFVVPRIPLCLSTLQSDVTGLEFSFVDSNRCAISAATSESTRTWQLHDS